MDGNPILIMFWFVMVMVGVVIMVATRNRGGRRVRHFGTLAVIGPAFALVASALEPDERLVVFSALVAFGLMALSLIGFKRPRVRPDRCVSCGYPMEGGTDESGVVCPECGTPKPGKEGHCAACGRDIRNAIAGGTIVCPFCRARLP